MDDTESLERVRALRAAGSPPKAIARALGMPPAQVNRLIRTLASLAEAERGVPELLGCWISPGWSVGLNLDGAPDWPDDADDVTEPGITLVLVARAARWGQASMAGFLVDTYCLGVKNALGPQVVDDGRGMTDFRRTYFDVYRSGPLAAPLDLAQHLVLGAVEYSRGLGFEPHPDFALVADHLGEWTGPSAIGFGYLGKPYYQQGPYDRPAEVMRTLRQTVGDGGFTYLLGER